MNIIDISQIIKWREVKRALKYHYKGDKNNYEPVFLGIQQYKPRKLPDKCELEIYSINDPWDGKLPLECYYYIRLFNPEDAEGIPYSLSFQPWKLLASYPIKKETLHHYTYPDIIAHFIWEITFFGNEKQMRVKGRSMFKLTNKAIKEIEYAHDNQN